MNWNEWDPLKEVIVGKVYNPDDMNFIEDIDFRNNIQRILAESEEDFIILTQILQSYGVKVHRPDCKFTGKFLYPAVCPRDMHVVYGEQTFGTIGGDPNRYYESSYFEDIVLGLGLPFEKMPRPNLPDYYLPYRENKEKILYHAANILKCGDALLYTKPWNTQKDYPLTRQFGRGTYKGLQWLQDRIDANWIEIEESGHADGKIALIKPGLLLCWRLSDIPKELEDWDSIVVPKIPLPEQFWQGSLQPMRKNKVNSWLNSWIGHVDETVFDINVISISPEVVLTNGYNKEVAAQLKRYGVEMVPFNFRNRFFWDGGLHCVTLDLVRDSNTEKII